MLFSKREDQQAYQQGLAELATLTQQQETWIENAAGHQEGLLEKSNTLKQEAGLSKSKQD